MVCGPMVVVEPTVFHIPEGIIASSSEKYNRRMDRTLDDPNGSWRDNPATLL